jgi:CBS domain-containing protein
VLFRSVVDVRRQRQAEDTDGAGLHQARGLAGGVVLAAQVLEEFQRAAQIDGVAQFEFALGLTTGDGGEVENHVGRLGQGKGAHGRIGDGAAQLLELGMRGQIECEVDRDELRERQRINAGQQPPHEGLAGQAARAGVGLGIAASKSFPTSAGADLRGIRAADVMHRGPRTIRQDALAVEAAELMEQHGITRLFVVDAEGRLAGALNTTDLMRAKVI